MQSSGSGWHINTKSVSNYARSINKNGDVWKRSSTETTPLVTRDTCVDPFLSPLASREVADYAHKHAGHTRRQATTVVTTQGYTTTDAFGTDGDDTAHSAIAKYDYPHFFQALGGFPEDGGVPDAVDLIFIDYIQPDILDYLGDAYSAGDVSYYIDESFSTRTYLPLYVQSSEAFQKDLDNCTIY